MNCMKEYLDIVMLEIEFEPTSESELQLCRIMLIIWSKGMSEEQFVRKNCRAVSNKALMKNNDIWIE